MGVLTGLFRRLTESDEERLTDEVRTWCEAIPETSRIAELEERTRSRVAGVVRRITLHPSTDAGESLSAVVSDGTGELTARWTGRGEIAGLRLGSRVVLEGVAARERGRLKMVNPSYEFV